MRNWLFILGFAFLALILQTTALPSLFTSIGETLHWKSITHITINITFLVLLYICFSRSFFTALFWLFTLVLLQNSFDVPWKGALALSYLFLLVIIYILETMFVFQYSLSTMLIIFCLILSQNIFHLLMGGLSLGFEDPFHGEYFRIFMTCFISVIAAPFVFYMLYLIDLNTIFYFDKSKSFFGRRVGL